MSESIKVRPIIWDTVAVAGAELYEHQCHLESLSEEENVRFKLFKAFRRALNIKPTEGRVELMEEILGQFRNLASKEIGSGQDAKEKNTLWMVEVDGEPAGCLGSNITKEMTADGNEYWQEELTCFMVDEKYQGRKIGTLLPDTVLSESTAPDGALPEMRMLQTYELDGFRRANEMYKTRGFQTYDTYQERSYGKDLTVNIMTLSKR